MRKLILMGMLLAMAGAAADTVRNPLIWADTPDPDVIRVDSDYYMVTTTMHMMPGCPVMHSRDLVNWKTVSYVFDSITDNPKYDLIGGTVYGKGQWATTIRHHDGQFYMLFSPNDEPYRSFVYTSPSAAGPWTLVARPPHFHDSSVLFDDDGRVYVTSGSGSIRLTEMLPDLTDVKEGGVDRVILTTDDNTAGLHEGSRIVKKDGKYYIFIINWPAGGPRRQLVYRADSITGPYEYREVINDRFMGFPYVAQGTIVDSPEGDWWGIFFQDHEAVGRVLTLSPVKWEDGWPVIGDGEGHILPEVTYTRKETEPTRLVCSDDFSADTLGWHWQWNHNPVNSAWSLTERPGWLRLHTSRKAATIYDAPNTLTQRMEGPVCAGSVLLDLSGMKPGDVAGFGAFNGHSVLMSIVCDPEDGTKRLIRHNTVVNFKEGTKTIESVDDTPTQTMPIVGDTIWLAVKGDFTLGNDKAETFVSFDDTNLVPFGEPYRMRYDWSRLFMGQRFAIYNYTTTGTPGGYIDVDYFMYSK